MPELKRAERDVHGKYFPELEFRDHTVHINERHTFRRWIEGLCKWDEETFRSSRTPSTGLRT